MKSMLPSNRPTRRAVVTGLGLLALVLGALGLQGTPAGATGSSLATYTNSATVNTPAPLAFTAYGGGDGWDVAPNTTSSLATSQVFAVYHHSPILQVQCLNQSDATACWGGPVTITDGSGHNYATSGAPGLYLDPATNNLYVFAVQTDGNVAHNAAGVVCVGTANGLTPLQRFCGFTALSNVGDATTVPQAAISGPIEISHYWYAFNAVLGAHIGTQDQMLCFDLATFSPCASQPYAVNLGSALLTGSAQIGAAGSHVMVPLEQGSSYTMTCFDASTNATCTGSWPIAISGGTGKFGAPFPLLSGTGTPIGACLPIDLAPCYGFDGSHATAPPTLDAAIGTTVADNGPALVLGTRVYVPNGNTDTIDCFDYALAESCTGFPKVIAHTDSLYTLTLDPNRPGCIWTNANNSAPAGGVGQIQSVDAYIGGACQGSTRVLSSALVEPAAVCTPANYVSLQVTSPARNTYQSGTVTVENSNAAPLPSVPPQALSATGSVDLAPLDLTRLTSKPQFVITLNGASPAPAQLQVTLSWTGTLAAGCTNGGQTVTGGGVGSPLGYWQVASDGGIFTYGGLTFYGSAGNIHLNKPVVGMASTPDGKGYWLVASDGGIFAFGNAVFHGSGAGVVLGRPIVGMTATPDGKGYWLVSGGGAVLHFGDALNYGSAAGLTLNKPIVGMARTPDGLGYTLVASDGGVFTYGNAQFYGSAGNILLNKPIVGMAT